MNVPFEIKIFYIIATTVMIFLVCFIIFVVFLYNKRQIFFHQQQKLKESEHQNQMLQNELEKQKLVEQERERISHDMHDDLGAGISALKLQAEFMKQKAGENDDLKKDIDEILRTSEEMNLSMREMLWNLNSGNDNILNFVQYTTIYAENFFKKSKFIFKVKNKVHVNNELTAEIRRNLFLCVKEALNNVYKHSQAKNVTLIFSHVEKLFSVEICDDGVGIPDEEKLGNGLRNMQKRIEAINGNLDIVTNHNGSSIKISLFV